MTSRASSEDRGVTAPSAVADTGRSYFESMYGSDSDPWQFDTSWYEARKYALTLAALPQPHYRRAIEPGCAHGTLTEQLADRCDELISFDFIDEVVERARRRLADRPHVHVLNETFPGYWPSGTGDLVVWSEVAYYTADPSWQSAVAGLDRWLEPGGTLIAVHYTGATNYAVSGTEVRRRIDDIGFLERVTMLEDQSFELGVWQRRATLGTGTATRMPR